MSLKTNNGLQPPDLKGKDDVHCDQKELKEESLFWFPDAEENP